jgi:eukaryotic-like serine/threonine-protein kinase
MEPERDREARRDDETAGLDPGLALERPRVGSSFGRYRDLEFLGSGGMAAVYKAHDPTLGRTLALKLLRGDDPQLAERLLLEARAQARIEHEHVCGIYEAGVEGGRPYIAMQYVAGQTLKQLHASLSLEQKLRLIQDVAEAIHAAHRVGIVHRDLKPSNVMVERREDGALFPYVMDFGLAREALAPGLTATGLVLGTPWYMSPEQARGESRSLDRRSDVYSLGATLYELLGHEPPFDGTSSVEVVMKLLSQDPVPLSRREPSVPRDVETIVMKCLEKDPGRRYDSARALAQDLGRYLDGEPIGARPTGFLYRRYKRARRHKAVVSTGTLALLLVLASAGLGLRARASAGRLAELAAEFARDVDDVEWLMRVAHMAPLHDVRGEKRRVRERLGRIAERMRAAGSLARGPGEYALGRGQLLLGDPEAARGHLAAAWDAGFRTPQVAYAQGLALGEIYRRELELADSIGSRELREARRREIQAAYRDPAVAALRQATGADAAAPEYVEGLLAFYEGRLPEALVKADVARARLPWMYEASLLKGDVEARLSRVAHETGEEAASERAIQQAEDAYRAAADIARSEPAAYEGLCQMGLQRMEATLWTRGDLEGRYDAARAACALALSADPERAEVHAKLANIHRFWANHLLLQGREPFAALDTAAAQAREAIALDPRNRRAQGNLGVIYRLRAQYERDHGMDPTASLRLAFAGLERAVELSGGDAASLNDLGNAYLTRASDALDDPRPDLAQAVAHYDRALERVPDFAYAHANRATALVDRARLEMDRAEDPSASLQEALRSLDKAAALMPQAEGVYVLLAQARGLQARAALRRRADPSLALDAGREALQQAARINPTPGPDVLIISADLAVSEARSRSARGLAPEPAFAEARSYLVRASRADPGLAEASRQLGEAELAEAAWRVETLQNPTAALARARAALRDALRKDPADAEGYAAAAEAERRAAAWRLARGLPAEDAIKAGLAQAERALDLRPSLDRARAEKQALLALSSQPRPTLDGTLPHR